MNSRRQESQDLQMESVCSKDKSHTKRMAKN